MTAPVLDVAAAPAVAAALDVPLARALALPGGAADDVTTDVLVVGSGVAGLCVVAGLARSGLRVTLATKGSLGDGSTRWAQGGIARAEGPGDVEAHVRDTLVAGAGICDPAAVRRLVEEGPAAVEWLTRLGARFDVGAAGGPALTREGGHSRARIVHAGGDRTGAEVQRALAAALARSRADDGVRVVEEAFLVDLLRSSDGAVCGAVLALLDARGTCRRVVRVHARATVLAAGGYGQAFATTTAPPAVTGDGVAAALRAGATTSGLEFVQFHPTAFALPTPGAGGRLLISEAVRGEGAVLVDADGVPVMTGAHPLADLAPRDVVSATMAAVMRAQGVDHLYLDARGLGEQVLLRRFPTIVARCRAAGVDPVTRPVPVRPAAHYSCGGVVADLDGTTSLPGLLAVGEVASTGVHGANRLASNSLLEGLVAGRRAAQRLRSVLPPARRPDVPPGAAAGVDAGCRAALAAAADVEAGVLRTPAGLDALAAHLADTAPTSAAAAPTRAAWEATNLHALTTALLAAAALRAESRGCHRRSDVPSPVAAWAHPIVTRLAEGGLSQEGPS